MAGGAAAGEGAAAALRGFMLADSVVTDQAEYDLYRGAVLPSVEEHGGRFIIRGGRFEVLEGAREWHRLIGLEFGSYAAMDGWYRSPHYQELKAQRLKGARTDMVFVEETASRGGGGVIAGPEPAPPAPGTAPAYVIADFVIHDLDAVKPYVEGVAATHAGHGSRYLSRGGRVEAAEGEWRPSRLILIQFPSFEGALAWYRSDAYQALARIRQAASRTEMVVVEGHVS